MNGAAVALETKTVEVEAHELVTTVTAITVTNDAEYDEAAGWLKRCAQMKKRVKQFFGPVVKAAHEAHKTAKGRENQSLKPITDAERHLSGVMGAYQEECEAERRKQEALQREAERQQQEEQTLEIAAGYEAMGRPDLAEAAFDSPLPASTVKVDSYAPKIEGTASRTSYTFEIVDASLIPREYLVPDEKKIGGVVRAMKDETNIPGVRVVKQTKVHARG